MKWAHIKNGHYTQSDLYLIKIQKEEEFYIKRILLGLQITSKSPKSVLLGIFTWSGFTSNSLRNHFEITKITKKRSIGNIHFENHFIKISKNLFKHVFKTFWAFSKIFVWSTKWSEVKVKRTNRTLFQVKLIWTDFELIFEVNIFS